MWSMSLSSTGLELIKRFEGFRADAEEIHSGGWVIGYGHVRIAEPGEPISEADAVELLKLDLAPVERFVSSVVTHEINQSQFDALVSFAYSIGQTAFETSAVLRKVNAGQIVPAAIAMDAWRKASLSGESEIIDALVRRRAAEKALFLSETPNTAPSVYMRAELDHAASILAAPIGRSEIPALNVAPKAKAEEKPLAEAITEIMSAPREPLLLTDALPADEPRMIERRPVTMTTTVQPVVVQAHRGWAWAALMGAGGLCLAFSGVAMVTGDAPALGAALGFAGFLACASGLVMRWRAQPVSV